MLPRILMYSSYFPPEFSGAAKQALLLATELRRIGHEVEFLTVRWPGLAETDVVDGFRVTRLEAGQGQKHRELRLWWNMLRFLLRRRHEFDVVHSHGAYYTNAFIGPMTRLLGMRSVIKASLAADDLHQGQRRAVRWLHRHFLGSIDACIAISRQLRDEFLALDIAPERVHGLPNAVDLQRFRPASADEKAALRLKLGLPLDQPVYVFAGVIDARKNINWLADCWCEQDAFRTGGLLLVLGPQSRDDPHGVLTARLRKLQQQMPGRLRWIGDCQDTCDYLRAADAFVLPSLKEGLPNALLEAMACGLPCVAANSSGNCELVSDRVTGLLYTPDSAAELARASQDALGEPARQMGARARALMEKEYSVEHLARRYSDLYRAL